MLRNHTTHTRNNTGNIRMLTNNQMSHDNFEDGSMTHPGVSLCDFSLFLDLKQKKNQIQQTNRSAPPLTLQSSFPHQTPNHHHLTPQNLRSSNQPASHATPPFDMGWQKRATGRVYDSLSSHGYMIGCSTGKVISMGVLCKKYSTCHSNNKKF